MQASESPRGHGQLDDLESLARLYRELNPAAQRRLQYVEQALRFAARGVVRSELSGDLALVAVDCSVADY